MKRKKARILIHPLASIKAEWKKAMRGDAHTKQKTKTLAFTNLASLAGLLTPPRLELLALIARLKPVSIHDLAKKTGRDYKSLYCEIKLLADLGLVDLQKTSGSQAGKPVARFFGFELELAE